MNNMKIVNRKSISDNLIKYDTLAKDSSVIEIVEWVNGEGWDILIDDRPAISLTYGELEAIKYLVKTLELQ